VEEGSVKRCMELYKETKIRVRKGEVLGKGFWVGRGVRQGCPLSPLSPGLFNLLLSDLEEEMGKRSWGGEVKGRKDILLSVCR